LIGARSTIGILQQARTNAHISIAISKRTFISHPHVMQKEKYGAAPRW
jgi:hypothetical protein